MAVAAQKMRQGGWTEDAVRESLLKLRILYRLLAVMMVPITLVMATSTLSLLAAPHADPGVGQWIFAMVMVMVPLANGVRLWIVAGQVDDYLDSPTA